MAILSSTDARSLDAGPKIGWRLSDYGELDTLVDYLITVHRGRHERGSPLPTLAVFLDEAWRVAGRGADAKNPAVRLFTEGYQHQIIGVALSQWVSQVAHLIPGNAYQFYVFDLWERDLELMRTLYRMEPPEREWLGGYNYWRYDGDWWRGDSQGIEVRHDSETTVPKVSDKGEGVPPNVPPVQQAGVPQPPQESGVGVSPLRGFDARVRGGERVEDDKGDGLETF